MRVLTDLGRGLLAASTLATLQVASPVLAQYGPYPQTAQPYAQPSYQQQATPPGYSPQQPTYVATQPVAAPAPQQVAPTVAYQQYAPAMQPVVQPPVAPQYNPTQQYLAAQQNNAALQYNAAQQYVAGRPAAAASHYPAAAATTPNYAAPPAYPQSQQFRSTYGVPRTAMAYQNPTPASAPPANPPLTPPTEPVPPGAAAAVQANGGYGSAPQPVPAAANGQPYLASGATGYESYSVGNGAAPYGACNDYSAYGCEQPGTMDRLLGRNSGNYWFGGVYGLLMERDSSDKYNLAFASPSMPPNGYPPAYDVVASTADVDPDFQGGVEFRLGRTFGAGSMDPCSCVPCGPRWGLEGVYWNIFDDNQSYMYMPTDRTYSMLPMPGLEYDGGNGFQPVNAYWDYAPPADPANGYSVDEVRVRSSFQAQNIELNLLRLSICGGGCGTGAAMCNAGCDGGSCGTGYGCGGPISRFSCTGVCGIRFLDIDDSFMYGVDYSGPVNGMLNYWSTTDNRLLGGQLGCNGMYRIGCKWGVHMNTLVGVYGNDIDTHQYIVTNGGPIRYISTGEDFDAEASKTDVSMLGEVRLGLSYQATCRCRIYGGWRAMGITGLALATSQAPNQWLNANQGATYVNSNGSMILHGLQTGVEWNY